jgi:transcription elongation GreA/GreB family factor
MPPKWWTPKRREAAGFFGATVRYATAAGSERVVSIVGADEIDLNRHHISWLSPLGRALMKAGPGDHVVLHAPGGPERLEILEATSPKNTIAWLPPSGGRPGGPSAAAGALHAC